MNAFNCNQIHLISIKGISIRKKHSFSLSRFCVTLLISIKSFSTRRITFAVEYYMGIRQSQTTHVAPNYDLFLEHLKITTCAKIILFLWLSYLLQVDKEYLARKANEQAIKQKNSHFMISSSFHSAINLRSWTPFFLGHPVYKKMPVNFK